MNRKNQIEDEDLCGFGNRILALRSLTNLNLNFK